MKHLTAAIDENVVTHYVRAWLRKHVNVDKATVFFVDRARKELFFKVACHSLSTTPCPFPVPLPSRPPRAPSVPLPSRPLRADVSHAGALQVAERSRELRFPMNAGVSGHVATSGEVVNIRNAYEDKRFNQEVCHLPTSPHISPHLPTSPHISRIYDLP